MLKLGKQLKQKWFNVRTHMDVLLVQVIDAQPKRLSAGCLFPLLNAQMSTRKFAMTSQQVSQLVVKVSCSRFLPEHRPPRDMPKRLSPGCQSLCFMQSCTRCLQCHVSPSTFQFKGYNAALSQCSLMLKSCSTTAVFTFLARRSIKTLDRS